MTINRAVFLVVNWIRTVKGILQAFPPLRPHELSVHIELTVEQMRQYSTECPHLIVFSSETYNPQEQG